MAKSIGRYEIREQLGKGGMATVYLATDTRLDRQVALKLMDQQLSGDPAFAARFEREAKTVAALEHSNIVALYDYGEADGWLYLVMRYMKGGSLKEQIARGPLTTRQAYDVVRFIGSALDKAHHMGIIHRDLKPANILLDGDQKPYLSDFGIVKVAKGDVEFLTQTGQTLGTFAYMSPEQVMAEELDSRSDIYALGIILYEMLTGKHPFAESASSDSAMAVAHAKGPVPDITKDNPKLPTAFTGILQKALAKDPSDRFATGREMALAMYNALTGKPITPAAAATAGKAAVSPRPVKQYPVQPQPRLVIQEKPVPAAATPIDDQKVGQHAAVPSQPTAAPSAQRPVPDRLAPVVADRPYGQNVVKSAPETFQEPASSQVKIKSLSVPRWLIIIQALLTSIFGGVIFLFSPVFYQIISQPLFSALGRVTDNFYFLTLLSGLPRGGSIYYFNIHYWVVSLLGLYWLAVGLLTAVSILVNRDNWPWRLAVGILGIAAGLFSVVQGPFFNQRPLDSYSLIIGILGILIGLIEVIQSYRGAGRSIGILGAASIGFGLVFSLNLTMIGVMSIFGGIAAVILALRAQLGTS